ncbi:hypothetical protein P6144_13550 [Sphingomonas sp. HITSZ_GF]|uniref:hypothetical protein n=1 Tax=Sphingomonas sp. HITSZ_GF TaxID=3037247 RepID=UPI00240E990F|nr:hypothetical protein [Sphingomonas sp. HITSZ_GF]MDG2534682.1 hypothetical protein [Sphingomonas sp. HITSZ_GF]
MKSLLCIAPLALIALPAHAQSTHSTTVDRPNYEGSRTVTRDGQGSVSLDSSVTRKSDGATASRDYDRTRTDSGWTASGSTTGFAGRTAGFNASHSHGGGTASTSASASATGFGGRSVNYQASAARTGNGYTRSADLTGGNGRLLHSRDVSQSRGNGYFSRSVSTSRIRRR